MLVTLASSRRETAGIRIATLTVASQSHILERPRRGVAPAVAVPDQAGVVLEVHAVPVDHVAEKPGATLRAI